MPTAGAPAKGSGALHSRPLKQPPLRHKKPRGRGVMQGDGAETRNRTADLLITNQLLYRLSYFGNYLSLQNQNFSRDPGAGRTDPFRLPEPARGNRSTKL